MTKIIKFIYDIILSVLTMLKTICFAENDERILKAIKEIYTGINTVFIINEKDFDNRFEALLASFKIKYITFDYDLFESLFDKAELKRNLLKQLLIIKVNFRTYQHDKKFYEENNLELSTTTIAMDLIKKGHFDFYVGGAEEKSSTVIRAAIKIIEPSEDVDRISSFFIMLPKSGIDKDATKTRLKKIVKKQGKIFSDCAVQINPNEKELAEIAVLTAKNAKKLLYPSIAMLSYSTKGSGKGDLVDKVRNATKIARKYLRSHKIRCAIDGEMQTDAALNDIVRAKKGAKLRRNANVLVFPCLDSGNIGYKLVEYLGNYYALGPVLQGLNNTICDLSRGVTVDEIILLAKTLNIMKFE